MICSKICDIKHGSVRMSGVQVVFVAVSDMAAECPDDFFVFICMQRITDDQIFFRCFFQENVATGTSGPEEKFLLGKNGLAAVQRFLKGHKRQFRLHHLFDFSKMLFFFPNLFLLL